MMNKLLAVLCLNLGMVVSVNAAPFVAGIKPDQRPLQAPEIKNYPKDAAWFERSLSGVSTPYPDSVSDFLEDQGAWYTPFTHPGMVGHYDIRGWHSK